MKEMQTGFVEIADSDIATVEALHDLLIDEHGYKASHPTLVKARQLTHKMYGIYTKTTPNDEGKNSK